MNLGVNAEADARVLRAQTELADIAIYCAVKRYAAEVRADTAARVSAPIDGP